MPLAQQQGGMSASRSEKQRQHSGTEICVEARARSACLFAWCEDVNCELGREMSVCLSVPGGGAANPKPKNATHHGSMVNRFESEMTDMIHLIDRIPADAGGQDPGSQGREPGQAV